MTSTKVRNQAMNREEDADFEDIQRYHAGKKATVEVIVKVKKRRDEKVEKEENYKKLVVNYAYPKGSWGDLLSRGNKVAGELKQVVSKDKKVQTTSSKHKKNVVEEKPEVVNLAGEGDGPKSVYHKIPITSQLYLETHTVVRKKSPLPKEYKSKDEHAKVKMWQKDINAQLLHENETLRKEAAVLVSQMQKAKLEQQESISTMKDLYQLADLLKRENQQLIGTHEEQHLLQEKLVSVVSENQTLKQYLDSLMKKHEESTVKKGDQMSQLEKYRNVIQEVKCTIQDEMKGISNNESNRGSVSGKELLRGFEESALLNDSNASEIQRIFGSHEDSQSIKGLSLLNDSSQFKPIFGSNEISQTSKGNSWLKDADASEIQRILGSYE